jgi:uncharacterized protein YebE (UPF0316 family)
MSLTTLLIGLGIFLARIVDVSIGTVRTIALVQGRKGLAFVLGFLETSIWIAVVSTVIQNIAHSPALGFFFALGFASGNAAGIWMEEKLALGYWIVRVFSRDHSEAMARRLREHGQQVTTFEGRGMAGPVTELYIVCRRRDVRSILDVVEATDPEAFYSLAQARDVSNVLRPSFQTPTGWRAIFKKK